MIASVIAPVITARVVLKRLAEQGIAATRLTTGAKTEVVVSSYGARVYGPFFAEGGSSNWIPSAFADEQPFAQLIHSAHWNVGGDRVWIGPEISYMIPDRGDYWGSYLMPPSIDPGNHSFAASELAVFLTSSGVLRDFTHPEADVNFTLTREIAAANDPLRFTTGIDLTGIEYGGYSVKTSLLQHSKFPTLLESWTLNQVFAGGTAMIPSTPGMSVTDYYEPVGSLLATSDHGVSVKMTGSDRFKLGFDAAHAFGRMGYLRALPDGQVALVVRNSLSDPSSIYGEEPDFASGHRGDSLHLYNDDGGLGGFAELESRGRTIVGSGQSEDVFTTWWYTGQRHSILAIAKMLLGFTGITNGAAPGES